MHIGLNLALTGLSRNNGFTVDEIANGTLVLNFVDPPTITLSLDFMREVYEVWEDDTTVPGLVGYYKVKG